MTDYRIMVTPLRDGRSGAGALKTAFAVAERFTAHLDVLHLAVDPSAMVPLVGEGMSGMMVDELMEAAAKEVAAHRAAAHDLFAATRLAGVSSALIDVVGGGDAELVARGRLADLTICARPGEGVDPALDLDLNAALMESGRPVLVVPPGGGDAPGTSVAVAWNGSPQAARAVAGAMPYLNRAGTVTILVGDDAGDGRDLVAYLHAHGIKASARVVAAHGGDLAPALLAACGDVGADLLVMGAYTHSRLRQFILGGVTRHVLEVATIPLLMAH